MKVGVIGTGSMGTILIESFIDAGAIDPVNLYITNRTIDKAEKFKLTYRDIHVLASPNDIVSQCDIVFVCVKPLQFNHLLEELKKSCHHNLLLVSITSLLSVEQLEEMVDCKVARAIPSILNRAQSGPSLLSFGQRCNEEDKELLLHFMEKISNPLQIQENITRVASDIVSCGPAFMSYILQQFIDGAVRQTDITKEDATILATNMIIGLGKLLEKEFYTLPTLQERVCVPGGITGEGIKVLEKEIGDMFDQLFQQTHAKYFEDKEIISQQIEQREKERG